MTWTLMCDAQIPCRASFEGHPGEVLDDVRVTAEEEGWKVSSPHGPGYDYCPSCAERMEEKKSR
jgi:hypothetical protein